MNGRLFWTLSWLLLASGAAAVEIHVAPDGSGDAATIQDALDLAAAGDEIVLLDGVFSGPGNRDLDPGDKAVHLRSASGEPTACVIYLESHAGFVQDRERDITLEGLTLRRGQDERGGAVTIDGGSILAYNCRFEENRGSEGGAIYVHNDWSGGYNVFEDCVFLGNAADEAAAISFEVDVSYLRRCRFETNGNLGANHTVVRCFGGLVLVQDCRFTDNRTHADVLSADYGRVNVENSVFDHNQTTEFGAIYIQSAGADIRGCTFYGNAGDDCADIFALTTDAYDVVVIERCVTAGGEARASIVDGGNGPPITLRNCDVYSAGAGWDPSIAHLLGQEGNLDLPPLFCDPDAGDFAVADVSPCRPPNNPGGVLIGRYGEGCQLAGWVVQPDGSGLLQDIQSALDLAPAGGEVWLADGLFSGPRNRALDFHGKALTLSSLSGAQACLLDAGGTYLQDHRAFAFSSGEDSTSQVVGLTIRGGRQQERGGAVICDGASPAFRDCRFTGNVAGSYGGAVDCRQGAAPLFAGCVFDANEANLGGALAAREGSAPVLRRCTVVANEGSAGSLMAWNAHLELERSIVALDLAGPAVSPILGGTAALTDCDLWGNQGGDWTGPIADQLGQQGNFSEDPCFCDLDGGVYAVCGDSWCLPDDNPAGRWVSVGALGQGCEPCGCSQTTGVLGDPLRALPSLGRVLVTWAAPGHLAWQFRLEARIAGRAWTVPVVGDADGFTASDTHAALAAGGLVTYDLFLREDDSWRLLAEAHAEVPAADGIELLGAAPNPFNPRTEIVLRLGVTAPVDLAVFDLRGHRVATLWRAPLAAGVHRFGWDGRDGADRAVASGTYLCRLRVDGVDRSLKLALSR